MKRFVIFIALLVFTAGMAQAKGYEIQKKAGPYDVIVSFDRYPPSMGDNKVVITVKDESGNVVKDAVVRVNYSMPAMPGMPPMNYNAKASLKGDVYLATMDISMAGSWNVVVKIGRDKKTSRLKFTFDAK